MVSGRQSRQTFDPPPCLTPALPCAGAPETRTQALQDATAQPLPLWHSFAAAATYGLLLSCADRPRLIPRSTLTIFGGAPVRRAATATQARYQRSHYATRMESLRVIGAIYVRLLYPMSCRVLTSWHPTLRPCASRETHSTCEFSSVSAPSSFRLTLWSSSNPSG